MGVQYAALSVLRLKETQFYNTDITLAPVLELLSASLVISDKSINQNE